MDNKGEVVSGRQMNAVNSLGGGLFPLGRTVATPGALEALERANVFPATLLAFHHHGEWGQLDEEDRKANDEAVVNGGRILSSYTFSGERFWVITEGADDEGRRAATTILLPSEY